jgi:hypothetical protein
MPGIFEPNLLHDHFRVILNQGFLAPWSGVIFRSVGIAQGQNARQCRPEQQQCSLISIIRHDRVYVGSDINPNPYRRPESILGAAELPKVLRA